MNVIGGRGGAIDLETAADGPVDPREARSAPHLGPFCAIVAQLGLLLLVFRLYRIEEPAFLVLMCVGVGGFAVHYWLPFRFKEWFWIALSVGGAFVFLEPLTAVLFVGSGLVLYAIVASPLSFAVRLAAVGGLFAVMLAGRTIGTWPVSPRLWPLFGAFFMFRTIVYLYDLAHRRDRPALKEFLGYFFLLPNYYFLLFPVIDFQTMRRAYYQRDGHAIAQRGVGWMVRGTIQLLLYRVVYHARGAATPADVTSAAGLLSVMVLTYLLYLRVSGQFHIIVGFLLLFGYDLPETHRRYLLANSLTDFWRRINIYWKDFMVKVVYFPAYFRLRRYGERTAAIVATSLVFFVTWFLHVYQQFWLTGRLLLTWPDALFWGILGLLVMVNVRVELGRRGPPRRISPWTLSNVVRIAATLAVIVGLWSLWSSPTLEEWSDLLTWWQIG